MTDLVLADRNGHVSQFADPHQENLREQLRQSEGNQELLIERLVELEMELDGGWQQISGDMAFEFSRNGLKQIIALARIMAIKNPLIARAVAVQAFYTWARAPQITADDDTVNEVVQRFFDDRGNRRAFWGERVRFENDVALANTGNVFFVLFPNIKTGHVRIRTIAVDEIADIICNPQDKSEPWLYRREWTAQAFGPSGTTSNTPMKALYPDMRWQPKVRPMSWGDMEIKWDSPVYHVKSGGVAGMRFGVPETYASLSWARAYKSFLEDWASLVKSLSRFAWNLTTKNSKVQQAKTRLNTTLGTQTRESNPPPTTAAAFVGDENVKLEAIPKTGATTSATDGKQLRLMVASGMNIPDTILSGDVDQGNLATSKTLDRPTELAFLFRQSMWREVIEDIVEFVIVASVNATRGRLKGAATFDEDGILTIELTGGAEPTVQVTFPPILEEDPKGKIDAIVSAIGTGLLPDRFGAEQLLSALGADHIDELLDEIAQNEEEAQAAGITDAVVEALQEAKRALEAAA